MRLELCQQREERFTVGEKYLSAIDRLEVETDIARHSLQPAVMRPEKAMGEKARRKEVSVDPPYPTSPKTPFLDEFENLVVRGGNKAREPVEIAQHARAISKIATRKLTDDEGVYQHDALLEKLSQ
jgi:hypothetical protein